MLAFSKNTTQRLPTWNSIKRWKGETFTSSSVQIKAVLLTEDWLITEMMDLLSKDAGLVLFTTPLCSSWRSADMRGEDGVEFSLPVGVMGDRVGLSEWTGLGSTCWRETEAKRDLKCWNSTYWVHPVRGVFSTCSVPNTFIKCTLCKHLNEDT